MAETSNYDVVVHDISYELAIKELGFSNEDKKQEENLIILSIVMNQKKEELEKKINGTYSKFVTDNPNLDIPTELKLSIAQDALDQVSSQGLTSVSEIKIDTENTNKLFLELLSEEELNRVNSEKTTVADKEVYEIFKILEENREVSKEPNELNYERMTNSLFNFNTNDKDLKDIISSIMKVNQYIGDINNFDAENEAAENDPNIAYRLETLMNAGTLLGSEIDFLSRDSVGIYARAENAKVLSDLYYLQKKNPDDEEIANIFKALVAKRLPQCIDSKTGEIDIEKLKHYYTTISMGKELGDLDNPEKDYVSYKKYANIDDAKIERTIKLSIPYLSNIFKDIVRNEIEAEKIEVLAKNAKVLPIDSFLRFLEEELARGFDDNGEITHTDTDIDVPLYKNTIEEYFKITLRELIRAKKGEREDFLDDEYTKENKKNIYSNIKKVYGEKIPIDIMEMMYYADPEICKEIFDIEKIEDIEKSEHVYTKSEEQSYIKSKNKEDIRASFENSWKLKGINSLGSINFNELIKRYPIEALNFLNSKVMDNEKVVLNNEHLKLFSETLLVLNQNKKKGLSLEQSIEIDETLSKTLDLLPKLSKIDGKLPYDLASRISIMSPEVIEKKYGMSKKEFLTSDKVTRAVLYRLPDIPLESVIILLDRVGDNKIFKQEEIEAFYKDGLKILSDALYHMTPNEKERLLNTSVGKKIGKAYQTILSNTNSENLEETVKLILNSDIDMTFLPAVINQNYSKETTDMINKHLAIRENINLKRNQKKDINENLISTAMFERIIEKSNNRK